MAFDILETHELAGVIRTFPPVSNYWLGLCFPNVHFSTSEFIDFDVVDKARRLAPFVAPNVQGQPMLARRESIRKFKPAYLKPKEALDPARNLRRRAGEDIGGSLTPAERNDAIIAETLLDQSESIDRRLEWMACEAIKNGQVTVAGENYPTVTVGFGRRASNSKTLAGAARWNQASTATPISDIKGWATEMLRASGRRLTRVTLTPSAEIAFFAAEETKYILETRRGSLARAEQATASGEVAYKVMDLPGGVEVWVYNDVYEDNDGIEQPFVEDGLVILTGDVEGVRAFGAIMDNRANWEPMSKFPKMWQQEDPSGIFLMTQSAPLMIPGRPDASMRVNVLGE